MNPWKTGVTLILTNPDGKVLLGKRKGSHGAGTWGFSGGHLELGEDPRIAALRELREETGIIYEDGLINLGFTLNEFPTGERYIDLVFQTDKDCPAEPKVMEPNKCECWRWFDWNELPQPLFLPVENYLTCIYYPSL